MTGRSSPPLLGAIEAGGTKFVLGVGTAPDAILARTTIPTEHPDVTLCSAAEWLASHGPLAAIGVGSFGPIRLDRGAADFGHILETPKVNWTGAPMLSAIAERNACPIVLDTDVGAAALAENTMGAAQGFDTLVYLTIGTGVGGAILDNGRLIHGALHPELGHVRMRRQPGDDFAGTCPFHGDCLEGLISGTALLARFGEELQTAGDTDPRWTHIAGDLAELFAMLILTVSPQRIVVGGGVTLRQPHLLDAAIAQTPAVLAGYFPELGVEHLREMIVPPALGHDAGLVGAFMLAKRALG